MSDTDSGGDIPTIPAVVLIGFLLLIAIALLAWALYNQTVLSNHNLAQNQSAYCINTICTNGTNKMNYQLDPGQNPNDANFETINYCTSNAAPTSFVQALQVCASGTITPTQITSFANFYNNNYINTCGLNWKTQPPISTQFNQVQTDPTLTALYSCSNKLGVSSDPNIQALKQKTGQQV